MPYLKEIATLINTELQNSTLADKRFDKGSFYSIAKKVKVHDEDTEKTVPCVVDNDGEATELTIDDVKPFMLYHRTVDLNYEEGEAYGDDPIKRENADMRVVVYMNRKIMKIEPELLVAAIEAGFLTQLAQSDKDTYKLQMCGISVNGVNLNSEEVYSDEYGGDLEYELKPNEEMFAINYSVVSEYDKSCVDIC